VLERGYTAVWSVILGLLAGILTRETPFQLIEQVITTKGVIKMPFDGNGMVPTLQNYWNNIHPPVVFFGFASLAIPFCYAMAGVLHKDTTEWVKLTRGPVIFGMTILGVGISLGGLWAYETLNWGGFWGWDPVENVSLVPWLFLVVLSHGIIMQTTRNKWVSTNVFLGGLPFISFVYGTFLTRSGLLDKVSNHSFAQMERGALQILRTGMFAMMIAFVAAYIITLRRQSKTENRPQEPGVNRETFYQMGMLSLCLLASVIALGMSWPVITALRGGEGARVEEAVYHRALIWFFIPIMVAIAVGPIASWKREGLKSLTSRLITLLSLSLGTVGALLRAPALAQGRQSACMPVRWMTAAQRAASSRIFAASAPGL
jgi:cytochrome c-type biogenesis protein CcmF